MTKRIKIFLFAFIFSLPFWWGTNVLEKNLKDLFFWQEIANNPQILTAQINAEEQLKNFKPIRNWEVENLEIGSKSAISVLIDFRNNQKILFKKGADKKLPIASLTKLMTTQIVLENYDLSQIITISKNAVKEEGDFGKLKIGEVFRIKDLLYPLLMESSNDAAYALAELIGKKEFIALMNLKAKNLGMENTLFVNPNGLDPDKPTGPINYSTAEDLVKITDYLLKNQPLIWEILSTQEFDLYSPEGVFHHKVINTNELLKDSYRIVGGKTGWTPEAQGCLLLVLEAPKNQSYLIDIILGSKDRFGEMKNLVDWINKAYKW